MPTYRGLSPEVTGGANLGSATQKWARLYMTDSGLANLQNDFSSDAGAHNSIYRGKELSCTWAELQAKAVAGDVSNLYIGDYKKVSSALAYDGENLYFELAHIERYSMETGKCRLYFVSHQGLHDTKRMNVNNINNGTSDEPHPWKSSELYSYLNDESTGFITTLPADLRSVISARSDMLEERYSSGGTVTEDTGSSLTSIGKIWIPSEVEVCGYACFSDAPYGAASRIGQLSIFRLSNYSRNKYGYNSGSLTNNWWSRSVAKGQSGQFVYFHPYLDKTNASTSRVVVPCFCID